MKNISLLEILKALFPMGDVTGAPKISDGILRNMRRLNASNTADAWGM
ncbi:MAG: hypothetical protein R2852_05090 [Bacteroidia bacterium]